MRYLSICDSLIRYSLFLLHAQVDPALHITYPAAPGAGASTVGFGPSRQICMTKYTGSVMNGIGKMITNCATILHSASR